MIVGVLREVAAGETRVALTPLALVPLIKTKLEVIIERGAGAAAGFTDEAYVAKGAKLGSRAEVLAAADILLQVNCLGTATAEALSTKPGALVIGFCNPLGDPAALVPLATHGVSLISMELIPRITRAQSMDALSSQANLAGYKAVVLAAETLPKIFPMMMTAAGTLQAAKVFVIGAGVAGLQAIATAKRLGAVVSAFDVRAAVKEQVQSVGAKFIELPVETSEGAGGYAKEQTAEQQKKQAELMAKVIAESDVVITTALVPGRPAPKLIPASAVQGMQPGSVIVDMAAERGGNCELTVPGQTTIVHGVTILAPTNIPATVPNHASSLYANNLVKLLALMVNKEGVLKVDPTDDVIAGCLVSQGGAIVHPKLKEMIK